MREVLDLQKGFLARCLPHACLEAKNLRVVVCADARGWEIGGLHYYINDYCDPGSILATFNNADPGTVVATDVSARRCALSSDTFCGCCVDVPQLACTTTLTAPAHRDEWAVKGPWHGAGLKRV